MASNFRSGCKRSPTASARRSSRYGELTGQAQGWSLFAPIFGHQASLPMVHFSPASANTPPPVSDIYVHYPKSDCRLFNYEYRLTLLYWTWDRSSADENQEDWRKAAIARVRRQNRSMLAYMTWKLNRARESYPFMGDRDSSQTLGPADQRASDYRSNFL